MPIGLNYTHEHVAGGILLPNYVYLLDNEYALSWKKLFAGDMQETQHFLRYIRQGALEDMLANAMNDAVFDVPLTRNILFHAYDYEVRMKCLGEGVENNIHNNQELISLFNEFFHIDYYQVLQTYKTSEQAKLHKAFVVREEKTYTNCDEAVNLFMGFVRELLTSQGAEKEATHIYDYMNHHLHVTHVDGISGVTSERGGDVYIELGNKTYTTLFHELVHFVNRYFRYHYFQQHEVCFDNFTRTNEGLSNFVAYHCEDAIVANAISSIEDMSTQPIFFSTYIEVYSRLLQEGTNERKHNFGLIHEYMHMFEGDLLTPKKLDFYIQRFYKFFHYDQHEFFYPKELMYHIGYHEIREMFAASKNKIQLLTQCLMGKVCL